MGENAILAPGYLSVKAMKNAALNGHSFSLVWSGEDVVREVLCSTFVDSKSRLGGDALSLVCEVGKLLVVEGALRASAQALRDGSTATDVEHVEKCLPQLMLDFP